LKEFWDPIKAYWADHSDVHRRALNKLVSAETTKFQYTDGVAITAEMLRNAGVVNLVGHMVLSFDS
jgi:hypothetical protein